MGPCPSTDASVLQSSQNALECWELPDLISFSSIVYILHDLRTSSVLISFCGIFYILYGLRVVVVLIYVIYVMTYILQGRKVSSVTILLTCVFR